jgi:hypothetical protein
MTYQSSGQKDGEIRARLEERGYRIIIRFIWDTAQFDLPKLKLWLRGILERGEG